MEQAQANAPLDPAMEAVLANLPEAARIAARASAAAAAASAAATDESNPAGAVSAKEPTLAELLKAQSISLDGDGDVTQSAGRTQSRLAQSMPVCATMTVALDSDSPSREPAPSTQAH